jgi:Putative MetA-pathway of phenol degradation
MVIDIPRRQHDECAAPACPSVRRVVGTRALLCALLAAFAATARAAHPTFTEDTPTQGAGHVELELGLQRVSDGGSGDVEFGPQLSWGVLRQLDLIVRPAWNEARDHGANSRGIGDTAVDAKWRFLELRTLSLGLRAGVDLPTGNVERGLGAGKPAWHGTLIATFDARPLSFSANAGWIHAGANPSLRRDQYLFSGSVVWTARPAVKLSAEAGTASNPDPLRATWPLVARVGLIVVATRWMDLDIGYETRLNRAAPDQTMLAGATLRW